MVPEKYIRLVKEMYRNVMTRVHSVGMTLSPFLFNIIMDVLIHQVREESLGACSMLITLSCVLKPGRSWKIGEMCWREEE